MPALKSLQRLVGVTRSHGLTVDALAIMDRPDDVTATLVREFGSYLEVREVDNGDLGRSRNDATDRMPGEYLAFLDGDDLWGERWLVEAYRMALAETGQDAIYHPEMLYYFDERDFDCPSAGQSPSPACRSFLFRHVSSDEPGFNRAALLLNNLWSANAFARREVFETCRYHAVDRERGFGVEDWAWNVSTLASGVVHRVVPDTVHMIRIKPEGSLGQRNVREGLTLPLPAGFCMADWLAG